MLLGEPVGSPLGYYINILLGFAICNYFGTREGYLVGFYLVILAGLMIGTGEGYLVGLSLGLPLGSPLDSKNHGADLSGMLLDTPLGFWFGSEMLWGVGIYCVPTSGAFIISKINSVRYFQLLEFPTLSLSLTWLIHNFEGIRRADEIASIVSIPFILGMDDD